MTGIRHYERRCKGCGTLYKLLNAKLRDAAEWYRSFCQHCGEECEDVHETE